MRRILIAAAILVVGWFALKDWAFAFMLGEATTEPEAPDYYYDEVWLERPAEQPQGGWAEPWGVDLFVIPPPVSSPARKGSLPANHEKLHEEYEALSESLQLGASNLTIYTPAYRSPSPASRGRMRDEEIKLAQADLTAAMKRYLSAENRLRGVVILATPDTEPLLYAALQQLPDTEEFRQRFGGVLLPDGKDTERWEEFMGNCSPAFEACAIQTTMTGQSGALAWLTPSLPRQAQSYVAEPELIETIETRLQTLTNWLDLNAEKPAEPFDTWAADEVVDVAPIHRPNGEQDISGERGD
ncbi:MAG: DUF3089 domain-containing protein [Henriciella sp.]|uniref:hypothetical protein n=1 Tax=Henriciella sp. TaxID=1968823 RepID=UPI0032EC3E82